MQILALRVLDPGDGQRRVPRRCVPLSRASLRVRPRRAEQSSRRRIFRPDRAGFRRTVAQRCLYGVDLNPMAVQLARLSLWLTTMSGDRPLTFFDHNLRAGNSLVGASRCGRSAQRSGGTASSGPLPLLERTRSERCVGEAVTTRHALRDGSKTRSNRSARRRRSSPPPSHPAPRCALEGARGPLVRRLVRRRSPERLEVNVRGLDRRIDRCALGRTGGLEAGDDREGAPGRARCGGARAVLPLGAGVHRRVPWRGRLAARAAGLRRDRRQSAMGDAPR